MTTKVKEKHERFGYLPSTVEMKDISYFLLLICLKMNDMIRDKYSAFHYFHTNSHHWYIHTNDVYNCVFDVQPILCMTLRENQLLKCLL